MVPLASSAQLIRSLPQFERVEQHAILIEGLELEGSTVDRHIAIVMIHAQLRLEECGRGPEILQFGAAAAGGQVDYARRQDPRLPGFDRPGPLVEVNVAIERDIDVVLLVERCQRPDFHIAQSGRSFPGVAIVVVVG